MPELREVVEFLVGISVLITAVANYLIINKLWKRKHLKDVAESISISAAFLGIATSAPLLLHFYLNSDAQPFLQKAIGIITGILFVLIGSGFWVKENRGLGLGNLVRRALSLERKESSYLIRAMTHPKGAEHIIRILVLVSRIDRHVHADEVRLIREFASRWHLDMPDLESGDVQEDGTEIEVRDAVSEYLALSPPHEQAAQLIDVLNLFVRADETVTREERIVLEELTGLIEEYLSEEAGEPPRYEVVIVPQSADQFEAAEALFPKAEIKTSRGGRVISVGTFFSHDYAEAVCQRYIALGLFTAQVTG
jgi:tellurite resistance protein